MRYVLGDDEKKTPMGKAFTELQDVIAMVQTKAHMLENTVGIERFDDMRQFTKDHIYPGTETLNYATNNLSNTIRRWIEEDAKKKRSGKTK